MTQLHLPRETSDALGMLGTIYNANILAQYLRDQGISTIVYTPQHFTTIPLSQDFCAHEARYRISQGDIVFCA
jgi:uridylate kinase